MIAAVLNLPGVEVASFITLAQSSADSGAWWLLFLGPVGGVAFYTIVYSRYRNTHRSHNFVHETRISAQPVTGDDKKVSTVRATQQTRIRGDNRSNHQQRVQRG